MTNEILRMQFLSGVITESEYKAKLEEAEEAQAIEAAKKIEDKVETSPSIEAAIDKLSDEEKAELTAALAKLGVTADSSVQSAAAKIAPKIEDIITEADEDLKKKVAKIASGLGIMLSVQNFIPIISLALGRAISPDSALLTGVGLTLGVGGALIGLAKALGGEKAKLEEFDMDQFSFGNSSSPKASFEDKWNDVPNANKEILKKSTGKEPVKIMASSKGANYVITKGSDGKFYRYQYTQAENPGKPMGPFSSEEEAKKIK